ncbi:MAG: hypothetical protein KBD48_02490 [Candidatus Pacebacteria bacterium]|nr:hypothetical protein [Candidatus Paceibacterota bacterium]MBP9716032.1 hypothetical protein [Candidatus Paceibacterota bacterium]
MDEKNNPTKIQNIHTYSSDMADAVREQEATVIKIALAEKERKDREKYVEENKSNFSSNIFYVIGGVALVVSSIWATSYFIQKGKEASSIAVKKTTVDTLIKTDEQAMLDVTNITNKQDLINAIKTEKLKEIKIGNTKSIVLYTSTEAGVKMLTTTDLLERLSINIPGTLARSLHESFMLGVYQIGGERNLFLVFSTNDYNSSFAGMLSWEPTILSSMFNLFSVNVSSSLEGVFETPWGDKIILNKDSRVLSLTDGTELLSYMFIDKNKLILTDKEETIKEMIQRLVTQNIKPI